MKLGILFPVVFALASLASLPAGAQQAAAGANAAPKETVTEELIRYLQQRQALSPEEAEHLIGRLRAEEAARGATAPPPATPAAPPTPVTPPSGDGTIRVPYLSESQRKKVRDEVKQEVIAQAKAEHWAEPNALPEWLDRFTFGGSLRVRYEADLFDASNSQQFINYQAINAGSPFDVAFTQGVLPPTYNTTKDRRLPRFRLLLDVGAKVSDTLSTSFRFSSGNNTNPVSTNQTLGTDFNKTTFTIDRAYFDYRPVPSIQAWLGRMKNPWLSVTDLVWYRDLNFDGLAIRWQAAGDRLLRPFFTAGAFSVENTALDFPSNRLDKIASRDKWLYAAQLGLEAHADSGFLFSSGVAYYYFHHLEGRTSSPCVAILASDSCDTDDTRPGFLQKGNTLFALRDLVLTSDNLNGPQYQYFGLASPYRILDVSLQASQPVYGPMRLVLSAEGAMNLAFNREAVLARLPVNNYDVNGQYKGGRIAAQAQLLVGYPEISKAWQWNAFGGYRRVDSDAVVDAFTDSDFYMGGTNTKGFYVGGSIGFTHNAWILARWLSATEVSGQPLSIDTLQLDVNARF